MKREIKLAVKFIPDCSDRSNESIPDKLNLEYRLLTVACERMQKFFGHILRSDNIAKLVDQRNSLSMIYINKVEGGWM